VNLLLPLTYSGLVLAVLAQQVGLPVSQSPELPEAVAERLGVNLPAPDTRTN